MRYYLNLHPITGTPGSLLRVLKPSTVDVWFTVEGTPGDLLQAQLDGSNGDTNYRPIPDSDVEAWKDRLALEG